MKPKGVLTTQRKAILEVVSESHDHPTAADVIDRLRERGCQFAYGTVYNSLNYLKDNGYIRELKIGDAARYDARTEDHQHIICNECGKVEEVFTHAPADWVRQVEAETGFRVDEEHILFKGVCAECRAPASTEN